MNTLTSKTPAPIVASYNKELKKTVTKKKKKGLTKDTKKSIKTSKKKSKLAEAQEVPVEFMSFSGGGASGAMYSGVRDALEESGKMKGIKAVAGSSAGAITAALIATGISGEDFRTLSAETNFSQLVDSKRKKLWGNDGKPLYSLIQKSIEKNFLNVLDEDIPSLCKDRLKEIEAEKLKIPSEEKKNNIRKERVMAEISEMKQALEDGNLSSKEKKSMKKHLDKKEQDLEMLEETTKYIEYNKGQLAQQEIVLNDVLKGQSPEFQSFIDKKAKIKERLALEEKTDNLITPKDDEKIRFKDLSLLRIIDPSRFKDLVVTAVNKKSGELEIFSPSTSPDTEVALACRASASIPLYFKSTKIDGQKYVDGGYRDNIPTKYFDDPDLPPYIKKVTDKKMMDNSRTMAFAFSSTDPNDTVTKALYSSTKRIYKPNAIVKFFANTVFKKLARVGGKFKYTESEEKNAHTLRDNALNVVPLDRSKVTALSFKEATRKAKFLHHRGYVDTMTHLNNHELVEDKKEELEVKDFLLHFYKSIDKKPSKILWQDKIESDSKENTKNLVMEICDKKQIEFPGVEIEKVLESASMKAGKSELSVDTKSMEKLIKHLNKPTTPLSIKKSTMGILGIEMNDPRLNLENTNTQNSEKDFLKQFNRSVSKFKFTKEDFKPKLKEMSQQRASKGKESKGIS